VRAASPEHPILQPDEARIEQGAPPRIFLASQHQAVPFHLARIEL